MQDQFVPGGTLFTVAMLAISLLAASMLYFRSGNRGKDGNNGSSKGATDTGIHKKNHAVKPLVAGNWKMNGIGSSAGEIEKLASGLGGQAGKVVDVMVCPPFTLLMALSKPFEEAGLLLGAQDCHVNVSGAHTGDISPEMVADTGATAVIVGHSERREDHAEQDRLVNEKTRAVWRAGLTAIVCIGETEGQKRLGLTLDVVGRQIGNSVPEGATAGNTVIAYEPVWAIGSGLVPTAEDVREVHGAIRRQLADLFGSEGGRMRILYGGSVKPSNAGELMSVDNVDGVLVGGASLKAEDFLGIIAAYHG